ncbi:lipase [Dichomitus squalens]|uniref:Lipase n=1 Tax=Dichomitus squalens TaxID=114155 RepID=A0A4Q9MD15_9APHY|nr:lipase [Dichomitus squalens]
MAPCFLLGGALLFALHAVLAVPAAPSLPRQEADATDGIAPLAQPQIESFKPYTNFANAAYCAPIVTVDWSCGQHCEANPNFKPTAAGGDGIFVQFWFVGFDPELGEVIVAHQGTQLLTIVPVLEDLDLLPLPLDEQLFPGVGLDVLVHSGFSIAQAETSQFILAAVKNTMQEFNTSKVTTVGHSLGASISLLDAVFLHLHLPDATVRFVGYGLPRVGDDPFVQLVDRLGFQVNHVANKKDLVPILPPVLLGYRHISGEVHIDEANQWINCPGHDNPSTSCTVGDTNLLLDFNIFDHAGPYDGVLISTFC